MVLHLGLPMEEDTFETICIVVSAVVTVLGMVFNGAFLLAIWKYTPPPLKCYSVLLFNFAFFDFLACFGSAMTMQRLLFSGWAITYIFNGACQFLHPYVCYFFHCFNCHVFAHSQWILLISFVYRWWILVKHPPERSEIIKLCLIVYIPSVVLLAPYTVRNSPSELVKEIMQSYYPEYNLEGYAIGGNESALEWSAATAVLYMCMPCPFIYTVIIIFRGKTLAYLNEAASNLSAETKKTHKKMIKALTIQACIPVFYLLGATQYMLGTFHFISGPIPEHCTFMAMEMMPMVTPLVSLYFITPYRRAVMKWLRIEYDYTRSEYSLERSLGKKNTAVAPISVSGQAPSQLTVTATPGETDLSLLA